MDPWTVADLGKGAYQFRWMKGYFSTFLVTREGVLAIDPISDEGAAHYREAIASVTDAPVTTIVYSHEHLDHIGGARVLAPDAEIIAHPAVARRLERWPHESVAPPTRLIDGDSEIVLGSHRVGVHYFGRNHGEGNLALTVPTEAGRMLVYVDVAEPVFVPFRNLPDTDIDGLLASLKQAEALDVQQTTGGHTRPGDRDWITLNYRYVADLIEIMREEYPPKLKPTPGEDPVGFDERRRSTACEAAVARMRSQYGHIRAFDLYAPYTADRIITYLTIGV